MNRTTYYSLAKPDIGGTGWGEEVNDSFDIIDGELNDHEVRLSDVELIPLAFGFGSLGSVLSGGEEAWIRVRHNGTLKKWSLMGAPSGSVTVDVWVDSWANYPPTDADSITNGNEPSYTSAQKAESNDLSNWSVVTVSAGDIIKCHIDSVSSVEQLVLQLLLET